MWRKNGRATHTLGAARAAITFRQKNEFKPHYNCSGVKTIECLAEVPGRSKPADLFSKSLLVGRSGYLFYLATAWGNAARRAAMTWSTVAVAPNTPPCLCTIEIAAE